MSANLGKRVCIVGTGSSGLTAIECLVEEGFQVTAFERTDHIGGLWHYSLEPTQTTAMPGTTTNVSRQLVRGHNTADGYYPSSKEMELYLESYALNFGLKRHINFSTEVLALRRDDAKNQWLVITRPRNGAVEATETYSCDRVIIATGPHTKPNWPTLEARDKFRGDVLHAFSLKEPAKYAGKTVVVVGFNATSADSIEYLRAAGAKKIYVSHRRSVKVMPRMIQGKPIDHKLSRRTDMILDYIRIFSPALYAWMLGRLVARLQNNAWPNLHEHTAFAPPRVMPQPLSIPCVSDNLPANLMEGNVESVQAIDHFHGPRSIALVDGMVLDEIDACVFATGSRFDFSALLSSPDDPTNEDLAPDVFKQLDAARYYTTEESYRPAWLNFLSAQYPHSLAFLGYGIYKGAWFPLAERFSMALAQLWQGHYPMPPRKEMDHEITKHFNFLISEYNKGWLHEVAGTELYERTGWGWKGWHLWWFDRPLYRLLMDGIDTAFAQRLFVTERGRKSWPGARKAIEETNAEVDDRSEKRKHD